MCDINSKRLDDPDPLVARANRCGTLPAVVVVVLLTTHVGLLAWGAARHSPTSTEMSAVASGLYCWQFRHVDIYLVNPPLIPLLATSLMLREKPATDWSCLVGFDGARSEFALGRDFVRANGPRAFWLFTLGRWACIPISVLGAFACLRWAWEMFGLASGMIALALWCFSPAVMGHGQLISADLAGAAMGVVACYLFWRWLRAPEWRNALLAGAALGLAQLSKMTWIVLFGLWPILWGYYVSIGSGRNSRRAMSRQALQLGVALATGIFVLNSGYGFRGSFQQLGKFNFISTALGGQRDLASANMTRGNRFANTWIASIPLPFPESYIRGIDIQKQDFEIANFSYLRGEWQSPGWWFYYLYALCVKAPIGTWLLFLLACSVRITAPACSSALRDELVVLAPAAAVFALVSSETNMNSHFRYVLPAFPFLIVWIAQAGRVFGQRQRVSGIAVTSALAFSVVSSLFVYPHGLSYFNELVGGPKGGHAHLLGSNLDWGQDILYLKRWCDEHPDAQPLTVAVSSSIDLRILGLRCSTMPSGAWRAANDVSNHPDSVGPVPGWYAISLNHILTETGDCRSFLRLKPAAMAGYSIYIYHISSDAANRVRRELGLHELQGLSD